jgi:hypothetical protein
MNTRRLRSIRNYIAGCKDEVIPLYQVDAKLLIELLDMRLKAADRQKRYNESRKDYLHQRYEDHKEEWKAQRRERYYREKKQRVEELLHETENKQG